MATLYNTTLTASFSGALTGTPADGDSAYFNQAGPEAYNTNLDGLAAIAFVDFFVGGQNHSSFGAAGTPAQIDADNLRIEGTRPYAYLSGVGAETIALLVQGGCRQGAFWSSADITLAVLLDGVHEFASSADVATLNAHRGAVVKVGQGGAKMTALNVYDGARVDCGRDATAAEVNGRDARLTLSHADAAIDTVNLRGGTLRPTLARPATLNCYGGVIDLSDADATWASGTINILGPTTVIPPRASWAGNWYGSATLVDAYKLVSTGPVPAGL